MDKLLLIQKLGNFVEYYSQALVDIGEFQTFATVPSKIAMKTASVIQAKIESQQSAVQVVQHSVKSQQSESQTPQTQNTQQPQNQSQIQQQMAKKTTQTPPTGVKSSPKTMINVPVVNLDAFTTLDDLKAELEKSCNCELKTYATKTVFGDGNSQAKILVIGEAPGQEEDLAGLPFIGRSGELLMNAFKSISLEREKNFYITNNIFWRPPGNRKPTDEEMEICRPYLAKIVEIIKPHAIICVGSVAAQNVLQTEETISSMRNKIYTQAKSFIYTGKIFAIYHPSYLLRNPSKKYDMYKDLLFIQEQIGEIL